VLINILNKIKNIIKGRITKDSRTEDLKEIQKKVATRKVNNTRNLL